jgi:hypothetical protein
MMVNITGIPRLAEIRTSKNDMDTLPKRRLQEYSGRGKDDCHKPHQKA